jgi:hypothetical protein
MSTKIISVTLRCGAYEACCGKARASRTSDAVSAARACAEKIGALVSLTETTRDNNHVKRTFEAHFREEIQP